MEETDILIWRERKEEKQKLKEYKKNSREANKTR